MILVEGTGEPLRPGPVVMFSEGIGEPLDPPLLKDVVMLEDGTVEPVLGPLVIFNEGIGEPLDPPLLKDVVTLVDGTGEPLRPGPVVMFNPGIELDIE